MISNNDLDTPYSITKLLYHFNQIAYLVDLICLLAKKPDLNILQFLSKSIGFLAS